MRIIIDCSNLGGWGGIERYTKFLISELIKNEQNKYIIIGSCSAWRSLKPRVEFKSWRGTFPFWSRHILFSLYLYWLRPDLVFSPAGQMSLFYCGKSVITVHDLAIYLQPAWFPAGQALSTKFVTPWSIKKAARIIAVSMATAKDLIKFMSVDSNKIRIVPEAAVPGDFQSSLAGRGDFILFVGTIEPRKNIVRILQAFHQLKQESDFDDLKLILAGKQGWKYEQIFKTYHELELEDSVSFLGYVDEDTKQKLYCQAKLLIFPSLYEGFGLPILEAQRAGLPVITSNLSAMPEVAGSGALLVAPESINQISQAIKRVLTDELLRKDLIEKGYENVKKFSWKKTAEETEKVFEEVLKAV